LKESFAKALAVATGEREVDAPDPREVLALRFYITSATLGAIATAAAIAVLAGWWLDVPALRNVFPGFVSMKPNAAVALGLTGVSILFYRRRDLTPRGVQILHYLLGATSLIAILTLFEHVTGWGLGIDQLLFADPESGLTPPGRMAVTTAVSLLLLNGAIYLARQPDQYNWAQALTGAAMFIATLNGVGYVFGPDPFAGVTAYSAMAVHTSVCILLLGLGLLFARPELGLMNGVIDTGAGGLAIRWLLPVVFVLPLFLAWLSWIGVRLGWYGPSFAMALFVALTTNVLSYAVWVGGNVLRAFDDQRRIAEAERARSEERLRRAVVDAPVPMVIHDSAGRILYMSRGWSLFSGYTLAETPTLSAWIAAVQPTGASPMEAYLAHVGNTTETVRGGEWTITTFSRELRTWDFSTTPIGAPRSADRALVTMAVDITERKLAESDLRRMNEELEQRIAERTAELTKASDSLRKQSGQLKDQTTLLDLVRDGILIRDLYGTIIYWSTGAADMYGWTKEEAVGKISHKLIRSELPMPLKDIEKEVNETGYWEGEIIQTTKDGARLSVESRWTLTRTDRGRPHGFLEVNRDITARNRAQESLRDSELRFRSVAETAIEGIFSVDEHGVISYWNPGAERLFGRPAAEAIGEPISIAIPDRVLSTLDSTAGEIVGKTFETTGTRADGSEFPIELSLSGWATSQGARFFSGIARDITTRKQTERDMEEQAAELARSNHELEQFAYVASHDLQEPLRMVSNYTQLLGRRYKDKLDSDANEFIEFAVDGAKRMQDLIHGLLEYARVGTRGKEFTPTPLDQVVNLALMNLSGAIAEAKAEIIRDPLPTLACDASQLTQVFQNLISNAIKFRRPGERPVIRVSATRGDGEWTMQVTDNGIGIEAKYFERIFQMFQRLHGRDEYAGTGIGLALCKKIVERHGGEMGVSSAPGQGTTFSVTIPDRPASVSHEAASA
jgi:PAS domain S-box-containing protein